MAYNINSGITTAKSITNKHIIGVVLILLLTLTTALLIDRKTNAASPRPHRPDVMSATPDTSNSGWVTGVSQDGGAKGQSLKMDDFAFYSFRNWWDQNLSDVTKVRASFMAADGAVNAGGSPRFSLMLDANGDGVNDIEDGTVDPGDADVNVFLDPAWCGDTAPGAAGWIEADFTGDRTNCTIFDSSGNSYVSDGTGTAWSKLVAAHPDAKVWFMFLIQDATTGSNYVDRIMLDSSFFTKQP